MKKVLVRGPALSRSGYGEHTRFILRALRSRPDLFDIHIHPVNWGQSSWDLNLGANDHQKEIQKCIEKTHQFKGTFDLSLQVLIPGEFQNIATKNMAKLNKQASEIMTKVGVNACSDITGFGLLGHLKEMASNDSINFEINMNNSKSFFIP